MPKPTYKVADRLPSIKNLNLGLPRREKDKDNPRVDLYFTGTVEIDGHKLPLEVHLMNDPHFDKHHPNGYYYSADVGHKEPAYDDQGYCPHCSGNNGVTSKPTKGLTAKALGDAVYLALKNQYELIKWDRKQGGWFTFDLLCKKIKRDDLQPKAPRFYYSWVEEITCPIHGTFLWKELEFNA
jgi:hypothetical protein